MSATLKAFNQLVNRQNTKLVNKLKKALKSYLEGIICRSNVTYSTLIWQLVNGYLSATDKLL